MMSSRNCWSRWLLVLPLVLSIACGRSSQPQRPQIATVRESCLRQPAPTLEPIRVCLDQASDPGMALDCLAQGVLVREAWIAAAVAVCGVVK
jgi:hypothetical protein